MRLYKIQETIKRLEKDIENCCEDAELIKGGFNEDLEERIWCGTLTQFEEAKRMIDEL